MEKITIEKRSSGYCLIASSHRALLITAQDLLDIGDWFLLHMNELEKEASQERNADALNAQEEDNQHG